jgi:hypothetical protein
MMMYGMGNLFWLWSLLSVLMVLGFSYIIWILAQKETGYIKTTGVVIACGIAALTVILALFGLLWGGRGSGMGGKSGSMMEMKMEGKAAQEMMNEMMKKNPEIKKMMKEMMK